MLQPHRSLAVPRRSAVARAAWAALATVASLAAAPAGAVILYSGLVSPDPQSGNVTGHLNVGTTGWGSLTVDGGSVLSAQRVNTGVQFGGDGHIVVSGAGSEIVTNYGVVGSFRNMNIGTQGKGNLSVLDGGRVSFAEGSGWLHISSGAGSEGSVLVRGSGSTIDTGPLGAMRVGFAGYYTQAVSGFNHGQAGGASRGQLTIDQGGTALATWMEIAAIDTRSELTGRETATGTVVIDGAGSSLRLQRDAAHTGTRVLLTMASYAGTQASLEVRNGALLTLDGSSAPTELSGMNLGTGSANVDLSNSQTSLRVSGPGSRVEFGGGVGFLNIGRGLGTVGQARIDNGGVITSTSANGLYLVSVGQNGGSATLDIDGAGSLLRLTGMNAADGSGAFLNIGRTNVAAGHGSVTLSNGGQLQIDTRGQVLTNTANQPGMFVGIGTGSTGVLTITGAGSQLSLDGGSGVTPFIGVGRDGASGTLLIADGGRLTVSSSHGSALSTGTGYDPGEAVFLNVGQRAGSTVNPGLSSGTLTVTGAGSLLTMSGSADRLMQIGAGANTQGTVNISAGGEIVTTAFLMGSGSTASGMLNMNAGRLRLEGDRLGGPLPGGSGISIGRSGGTGFAQLDNGSQIIVNTTLAGGGVGVGGSSTAAGGTGTLRVSGGSSVTVSGVDATVTVGGAATAATASVGTLLISGNGSRVSASGPDAAVVVASNPYAVGTVVVGSGSTLASTGLIGVAHDGSASTGGAGMLVVDGRATAQQLWVGSTGLLAGSGVVAANVANRGTINAGNSPGRLTIDGAFDNNGGTVVLEVQSLGNGQFALDELVLTDWSRVTMAGGALSFVFLGDTDPNAFAQSGLFALGSFLKQADGQALDTDALALFVDVSFTASAGAYTVNSLQFNGIDGSFSINVSPVPEPAPLMLGLLGLVVLKLRLRRLNPRPSSALQAAV